MFGGVGPEDFDDPIQSRIAAQPSQCRVPYEPPSAPKSASARALQVRERGIRLTAESPDACLHLEVYRQ